MERGVAMSGLLGHPKPGDMIRWISPHGSFLGSTGLVIAAGLDDTSYVIWHGAMRYEHEVNENLMVCEVDP